MFLAATRYGMIRASPWSYGPSLINRFVTFEDADAAERATGSDSGNVRTLIERITC